MKTKILFYSFCFVAMMACDDLHEDQLRSIGKRVVALEQMELDFNNQLVVLRNVVEAIQTHGVITGITEHHDGTYTLQMSTGKSVTLKNGKEGEKGKDGKDGTGENLNVSIREDVDGIWYWTLNGDWLLTPTGERMRVTPYDGKDGVDGKPGKDGVDGKDDINLDLPVPQTRINPGTGNWEISTDGGVSWVDTGVRVNGKDGSNDTFVSFVVSSDGKYVTVTLLDGRVFTFPLMV